MFAPILQMSGKATDTFLLQHLFTHARDNVAAKTITIITQIAP